jgi:hypothetical protein
MGNTQSDSSSIIHQGKVVKKSKEIDGIPFEGELGQTQER